MRLFTRAALFFTVAISLAHVGAAQSAPCDGKAPGKYCTSNPQMIMTCTGTAQATSVDCGTAIGPDGKEIIGRCVSNGPNDNKAICKMPTETGPCAGKAAGKYCANSQMIMTCTGTAQGTAVDCGRAMGNDGKEIIGLCVSTGPSDNKATCKMPTETGPCAGKAAGKYCIGPQMILTCKGTAQGTAVDCGRAMGQDGKEIVGRCISAGPTDNKAICKTGP